MHPRSPWYIAPPDFEHLSHQVPAFAKHVKHTSDGSAYIDFKDAEAVRGLTSALLLSHYGLHVDPPTDRLCPPIPNRLNYILWTQDLLDQSWRPESILQGKPSSLCPIQRQTGSAVRALKDKGEQQEERDEEEEEDSRPTKRARRQGILDKRDGTTLQIIRVLDIGTGAMAIYPLLGVASDERWSFLATDIDELSLESASRIVKDQRNQEAVQGLQERVKLLLRNGQDELIPVMQREGDQEMPLYHLTMCNPPFYASQLEMDRSAELKSKSPSAVCSGSPNEMITQGGEVRFVSRMIRQSLVLKEKVFWYSSMLGLLGSVGGVVRELTENGIENYSITEFQQGRTKRWAVAWSFSKFRLPDDPCRSTQALKGLQPASNERSRRIKVPRGDRREGGRTRNEEELFEVMERELQRFGTVTQESGQDGGERTALHAWIERDTWSRQARRARARAAAAAAAAAATAASTTAAEDGGIGGMDSDEKTSEPTGSIIPFSDPTTLEPLLCVRCSLAFSPTPSFDKGRRKDSRMSPSARASSSASESSRPDLEVRIQWTYGASSSSRLFESFSAAFLDGFQRALDAGAPREGQGDGDGEEI